MNFLLCSNRIYIDILLEQTAQMTPDVTISFYENITLIAGKVCPTVDYFTQKNIANIPGTFNLCCVLE